MDEPSNCGAICCLPNTVAPSQRSPLYRSEWQAQLLVTHGPLRTQWPCDLELQLRSTDHPRSPTPDTLNRMPYKSMQAHTPGKDPIPLQQNIYSAAMTESRRPRKQDCRPQAPPSTRRCQETGRGYAQRALWSRGCSVGANLLHCWELN